MKYSYKTNNFTPIPKGPHNEKIMRNAECHANRLKSYPSQLEKQMKEFLTNHGVAFEFQKIMYMKSSGGFIKNYYIVDFYIPSKKIVLEVDGSFHREQVKYDDFRTADIQRHYPGTLVVRWAYSDFKSYSSMKKLLEILE